MVGLLVNYLDIMGTTKVAYFKGDTEVKSQENIDRYFSQNIEEAFVSSSVAVDGDDYDHMITDEWQAVKDYVPASCLLK